MLETLRSEVKEVKHFVQSLLRKSESATLPPDCFPLKTKEVVQEFKRKTVEKFQNEVVIILIFSAGF